MIEVSEARGEKRLEREGRELKGGLSWRRRGWMEWRREEVKAR